MSAVLFLPKQHLRMDGVRGGECNEIYLLSPHCISVPYFHLRKNYIEMIEAFTEFHVNN